MWVRGGLGVVSCLVGLVWILQGTNVLHGSGMSGQGQWTGWGVVAVVIGLVLVWWARQVRNRDAA